MGKSTYGTLKKISELPAVIKAFVTDKGLHGNEAWEVIDENNVFPYGTVFRGQGLIDDTYIYINMLYQDIKINETYSKWFESSVPHEPLRNYLKDPEILYSTNNVPLKDPITHKTLVKDRWYYKHWSRSKVDVFQSDSSIITFSIHKQYQKGLPFYEQGGKLEFENTFEVPMIKQLRFNILNPFYPQFWTPPTYPSTRWGNLGVTKDNEANTIEYDYYIVKNRSSINVTLCHKIYTMNTFYWQSLNIGLLESPDKNTYPFPAFVAGGNCGFRPTGFYYANSYGGPPVPYPGLVVDYDITRIDMSNGTFINSCFMKIDGKEPYAVSNTMVMKPDGVWKYYANFEQKVDIISQALCTGQIQYYFFVPSFPKRVYNDNENNKTIFPNNDDISYTTTYDTEAKEYDGNVLVKNYIKENIILWNTYLLSGRQNSIDHTRGLTGFAVPNNYVLTSRRNRQGVDHINEHTNGKRFLIIPNTYADRDIYYPYDVGLHNIYDPKKIFGDKKLSKLQGKNMAWLAIQLDE